MCGHDLSTVIGNGQRVMEPVPGCQAGPSDWNEATPLAYDPFVHVLSSDPGCGPLFIQRKGIFVLPPASDD